MSRRQPTARDRWRAYVEAETERMLTALRVEIHESSQTQLRVQAQLGWGRTYISQLFGQQKTLRFDQILSILCALGVNAEDFFLRFYAHERALKSLRLLGAKLGRQIDRRQEGAAPLGGARQAKNLGRRVAELVEQMVELIADLQAVGEPSDSTRRGKRGSS